MKQLFEQRDHCSVTLVQKGFVACFVMVTLRIYALNFQGKEKELASESLVEILKQIDKVPTEWQHDLRNHAGG